MIQLHNDCLLFQLEDGQMIPCSVERFTFELVGDALGDVDADVIRNAASAVVHYFKAELNRTTITVGEFTQALEQVLKAFGLSVSATPLTPGATPPTPPKVMPIEEAPSDLAQIACESGKGFELAFFNRLRAEMRRQMSQAPHVVRFNGLRRCAKQLVGARRWNIRCERMSDQIVDYLRECLSHETPERVCGLVVR